MPDTYEITVDGSKYQVDWPDGVPFTEKDIASIVANLAKPLASKPLPRMSDPGYRSAGPGPSPFKPSAPEPKPAPYATKPVAGIAGAITESIRRKQEGEQIQSDIRMAQLNRELPSQLEEWRQGVVAPSGLPTDAFSARQAIASRIKKSSGGKALTKALGEVVSIPGRGVLSVSKNRAEIVQAMGDVAKFASGIPTTPEELEGLLTTAPAMVVGLHGLGKFATWAKATAASDRALANQIGRELGIALRDAEYLAKATRAVEAGGIDGLKQFSVSETPPVSQPGKKPVSGKKAAAAIEVPTFDAYISRAKAGNVPNDPEWEQFYLNNKDAIEARLFVESKKGAKGKAAEAVETPTPQAGSIPAASTKVNEPVWVTAKREALEANRRLGDDPSVWPDDFEHDPSTPGNVFVYRGSPKKGDPVVHGDYVSPSEWGASIYTRPRGSSGSVEMHPDAFGKIHPNGEVQRISVPAKDLIRAGDMQRGGEFEYLWMPEGAYPAKPESFGLPKEPRPASIPAASTKESVGAKVAQTEPSVKPVASEAPSTTPNTVPEPKVSGLDRVNAAKERLRARAEAQARAAIGQGGGEVPLASNYNFSKEDWADLIEIGRGLIEAGHDTLSAFASQLVSHVGDSVKPAIRAIWDDVHAARSTGLANQVQGREALRGVIDEIQPSGGRDPEFWQARGEQLIRDGANYRTVAAEISSGVRGVTPDDFAVALAGKTRLLRIKDDALSAAMANPGNKDLAQAAANAATDLQNYLEQVQQGKGVWSDIGRALQAGTEIDTGNFAQVLEEAARKQGITLDQVPGWMEKKYKSPVQEGAKAQAEIDRLKGELDSLKRKRLVQTFKKDPGVSYSRDQWKKDVTDAFTQFRSSMASTAASANDVLRVGGELTKEAAVLVYKVGWSTAKLGVVEAEALVKRVRQILKDELGEEITDQEIIDAMAPQGSTKSKTELQKEIQQLTQEFKRLSTQGKASALDRVQKGIDKRKAALAEGKYTIETKEEIKVSKELEQKMAERKFYDGQVRAMLKKEGQPVWKAGLQRTAGAVRSLTLAQDVGVLTRQALFMNPFNNPIGYAKGLVAGVKSARSDKVLAQVMRDLEERRIAGYHMGATRKKYGLSLSDPHIHQEEIASLHELGEFGSWVQRTFEKSKAAQHLGAIPGSLERFQTAFLNTARAESFDRAFAMGMTDQELALRANFINSVSGRSNAKTVNEWLSIIMTSPRYEQSRWEIPMQAIKNPLLASGSLVKSIATGKGLRGVNKAAVINSAQLIATAGEVYGLFKLAESAGYTVNWDPASGDFMKMRKGNDVWDVSAGLAPRIRDVLRLALWGLRPDYNKNWGGLAGDLLTRTVSPGVRVPLTMGTMKAQEMMGLPVKDPWSGFKPTDGTFTDWRALAPLTVQAFWQAQQEPADSPWWAFGREFVGGGVNFYPKRGGTGGKPRFGIPDVKRSITQGIRPRL